MDEAELLFLADANLAESFREQARWLAPYVIEENEHGLLVAAGTRFPAGPPNCLMPRGTISEPAEFVETARQFFARRGRGFTIYAPAHLGEALGRFCEASQWPRLSDSPGMVRHERIQLPALGHGIELRVMETFEQANDVVQVSALAFESIGVPAKVSRKLFSQRERWRKPHIHAQLVYDRGRPVASAIVLFSHGIAGIYWVSTVPDARGRGHGSLLTASVTNYALQGGARCVVLQATPFGEPVYHKLGFRQFTHYPWFLVPAPSP
jgi:GNAT superfamily N-acetyltransferase